MSDEESLSSILSNSAPDTGAQPTPPVVESKPEPKEVKPEPVKAEAPEPVAEKPRDETGKFTKKAEPMVPLSALLAERAKGRREPEVPKTKTSVFEDEDKGISERLDEHTAPLRQALFRMSVKLAQREHEDFDTVADTFREAAERDPRLWQSMREADEPASYIYTVGSQIRELADVGGDFVKYREKIQGELKAENESLKAQLAAATAAKTDLDSVPRSLNSKGSGAQPTLADTDPEDLKSIVRFGNKRG